MRSFFLDKRNIFFSSFSSSLFFPPRRNFTDELSGQKIVRLVFNGHVLQPDTKTLKACGLFDNCVVHCLVHNPRPYSNLTTNQGGSLSEQGRLTNDITLFSGFLTLPSSLRNQISIKKIDSVTRRDPPPTALREVKRPIDGRKWSN